MSEESVSAAPPPITMSAPPEVVVPSQAPELGAVQRFAVVVAELLTITEPPPDASESAQSESKPALVRMVEPVATRTMPVALAIRCLPDAVTDWVPLSSSVVP